MTRTELTIVPGWGLGREPLGELAATLNARIVDLPGYNNTPLIVDFHAAADALAEALTAPAAVMGWSLGGMLSLAAAARHPEKFDRLILIAGTASFVVREGWPHAGTAEQLAAFSALVLADPQGLLPRFVGNFNRGDRQARAINRQLLAGVGTLPPRAVLEAGLDWLMRTDLRPLLQNVQCPVLVMQGAHDPIMPPAGARALADALPDARLEIFGDAAHTPFLSAPDDFLDRLTRFLS